MNVTSLKYPVICFWPDGEVSVSGKLSDLEDDDRPGLRSEHFQGMLVVDSGGTAVTLQSARRAGKNVQRDNNIGQPNRPRLWAFRIDEASRHIIGPDEVRSLLRQRFQDYPEAWLERDDEFELKLTVERAQSITGFIKALTGESYDFGLEQLSGEERRRQLSRDGLNFIAYYLGIPMERFSRSSEISRRGLGIAWDDAVSLIKQASELFQVDVSSLQMNKHYSTAPQTLLTHIDSIIHPSKYFPDPITVGELLAAIEKGKWERT